MGLCQGSKHPHASQHQGSRSCAPGAWSFDPPAHTHVRATLRTCALLSLDWKALRRSSVLFSRDPVMRLRCLYVSRDSCQGFSSSASTTCAACVQRAGAARPHLRPTSCHPTEVSGGRRHTQPGSMNSAQEAFLRGRCARQTHACGTCGSTRLIGCR